MQFIPLYVYFERLKWLELELTSNALISRFRGYKRASSKKYGIASQF